jgi:hypothetical protein
MWPTLRSTAAWARTIIAIALVVGWCAVCEVASEEVSHEISGIFVVHKGNLILSRCDGKTPTRVAMLREYPSLAQAVYPQRGSIANGMRATVVAHLQPPQAGADSERLIIDKLVSLGGAVECDPIAVDRPLIGTQWAFLLDEVPQRRLPWLRFEDGDNFRGNDGCNSFSGKYELEHGTDMVVKGYGSTLVSCWPDLLGESNLRLGNLGKVRVQGRVLTLSIDPTHIRRFVAYEWD